MKPRSYSGHRTAPSVLAAILLAGTFMPLSAQVEVVSGGNVGVGTSSPGNKFTVEGTGDVAAIGSSTKKFYFAPDANGVGVFTGASKAGNGFYADIANNALLFSTNSGERLRIDSAGKLGLGTTTPSFPFSLGTALGNKIALYDAGSGAGYGFGIQGSLLQIFANTAADRVGIGYGSSGSFTETLTVMGGSVGIGTTSPGVKLELKGDEFRFRANASKTYSGPLSIFRLTTDDTVGSNALELLFYLNGSASSGSRYAQIQAADHGVAWARLLLNPAGGNVGINTATPGYALEVNGSVRAASFISNSTTYADFVFEPGYRLPALGEVEAHIKAHGHLPNIPSEAEAREHGIDLAAMQVKLLQKVEELTLYVIDLKKENAELRRRADRLERISTP